jgi:hypothetical protein
VSQGRIRQLGEAIGGVTLIVSVVFLALQVRQGNQIARAEASRELISIFNDFHADAVSDPATTGLLQTLTQPSPELTPAEVIQVRHLVTLLSNAFNTAHDAFEEGVLPPDRYNAFTAGVRGYIRDYPGLVDPLRRRVEQNAFQDRPVWEPLFDGA